MRLRYWLCSICFAVIFFLYFYSWYAFTQVPPTPPQQQFDVGNITGSVTLPTGASTEATLFNIYNALIGGGGGPATTVRIQDGAGNPLTSQPNGTQQALDVGVNVAGVQVDPRSIRPLLFSTDSVDSVQSGTWNVNIIGTVPLPTGAATEATLNAFKTANHTDLGTINTTLGSPFQAGGSIGNASFGSSQIGTWTVQPGNTANTTPWLTTINQGGNSATVTGANALKVDGSAVNQPVTQVTSPWVVSGSGNFTVVQPSGANLHANIDNFPATQPISGTVTTNQGTNPWIINGNATVTNAGTFAVQSAQSGTWTVQPGNTANTTPWLMSINQGGNTAQVISAGGNIGLLTKDFASAPTAGSVPTNAMQAGGTDGTNLRAFSVDTTGKLNVNNVSGTISLPTGASTSANQTNASQKTQIVDGSGNVYGPTTTLSAINYVPVVQASSGTPGSAVPARSTVVAGSDGTNAQTLSTDTTGKLNLNNISGTISLPTNAATAAGQSAIQPRNTAQVNGVTVNVGTGTAGTGTQRVAVSSDSSITANAGTNLNTSSLALDTSVNGLLLSQASTTSGQKGTLAFGAATTAAPTLVTGQSYPLSLNLTGETRVTDEDAEASLAQIVTNTATANSDTIVNGNITAVCTNANINACGAGSTVSISAFGIYTTTISVTGTWVATVVIDGQYPDNTWGQLGVLLDGTTFAQANQLTANGKLVVPSGGYQNIRARASAFTSGTVAVGLEASIAQKTVVSITIPNSWNVAYIHGAATTTIKTGQGVIHNVCVNNGTAGSTTITDSTTGTSGTKGIISTASPNCFPQDWAFSTGLTLVTTNASNDVTVQYQFPWWILLFGLPRRRDFDVAC